MKGRMIWRSAMLALCALFVFMVWVYALQDEQKLTLRFQFKPKQVLTYESSASGEMAMSMQVMEQDISFSLKIDAKSTTKYKVEKVEEDGTATILVTTTGKARVEAPDFPGAEIPEEQTYPPTKARMKINPLGKILMIKLLTQKETEQQEKYGPFPTKFSFQTPQELGWDGLLFPEKPVSKGDNWDNTQSAEVQIEDQIVKVEIKGQARLVDFEKLEDKDCAILETDLELLNLGEFVSQMMRAMAKAMPEEVDVQTDGEIKNSGKHWFNYSAGQIVKAEGNTDLTMNFAFTAPTGQSFSMSMRGTFHEERSLKKMEQGKEEEEKG